jgi:cardiolipin synthase
MVKQKTLWNNERNFFDAGIYYDALIKDINAAQELVFLESYIFELDIVGNKIIEALTNAHIRGLEIKVLIDGLGSMDSMDSLLKTFKESGISLKVYHPLPWNFESQRYAIKKGRFLEKFIYFIGRINNRDHRKLCVIDKKIAWTGSFNISHTHLSKELQGNGWKDHGVRVTGENVNILADEFLELWYKKSNKKFKRSFRFILSSLNPAKRKQKIFRFKKTIDSAKERIWIANAYFSPHRSIVDALAKAKERGVDVRIIVGGVSDIFFFPSLTRSYYLDLIGNNIEVYEWQNSILHSKIFLYDNNCYTGSSNLNNRSYIHDLELDIQVNLKKTISEIEEAFKKDFESSEKIEFDYLHNNAAYIFIMGFFPKLLRYWL